VEFTPLISREFLRFLATGGIAALVNLLSRYALNKFLSFEVAVALAYLVGMLTAFVLARRFVFAAGEATQSVQLRRFALVNVFSLALAWCTSVVLARHVFPALGFQWHADDVAHFIGVAAPVGASYFGHRAYTFGNLANRGRRRSVLLER
jgi:putative flippase GtrA